MDEKMTCDILVDPQSPLRVSRIIWMAPICTKSTWKLSEKRLLDGYVINPTFNQNFNSK
jgi:hypothetical protein